jgi:glycosyltransferase XagB
MGVLAAAAIGRSRALRGALAASLSIDPWTAKLADSGAGHAGGCPEIDCVRSLIAADVIEAAERRAAALDVGADRVLIAAGELSEEAYLRAFGDALGVPFEPLGGTPRTSCPLNDDRLIESAAAGMLPLAIDNDLYLVVAPRGGAARQILRLIEENPARARRFRFTSAERLNRFMLRCGGKALAARAAGELKQKWPMLSAAPPRWHTNIASVATVTLLTLAAAVVAPAGTMLAFEVTLAAVFLAWLGLRLAGAFLECPVSDPSPGLPDDALPVYTVIAALYREAASVDGLLSAIERLRHNTGLSGGKARRDRGGRGRRS